MKTLAPIFILFIFIFSCQKEFDFTSDIDSLRKEISTINKRLDSLTSSIKLITSQLTNVELQLKQRIDVANSRIDSISGAFNTIRTQVTTNSLSIVEINKSLASLSSDIKNVNTNLTQKNSDLTNRTDTIIKKIDSSFGVIRSIDSLVKSKNLSTDSINSKILILNSNYNDVLSKYIELLKIVKVVNDVFVLTGKIEKGPFSKGSIITFFELDSNLSQTGKSFSTTIDDNQGNYDLRATGIAGKLFRVQSDGFYFNENTNSLSPSRIVLTGITKVDSSENVNVNVLTHIERRRVQYLISEKKLTYDSAKKVAIAELLKVFGYINSALTRSEKLNLFNDAEDVLLNLSIMLQGYRTDAQLSELLTDLSNDFFLDGVINDLSLLKTVYNHSHILDTTTVTKNLRTRFNFTPKSYSFLKNYVNSNTGLFDASFMPITYPSVFNGSKNILERIKTDTIDGGPEGLNFYNAGFISSGIQNFEFKLTIVSDSLYSDTPQQSNYWIIDNSNSSWIIESNFQFDNYGNQSVYTSNSRPGIRIQFKRGKYYLKYFEPSSSSVPTFIKTLIVR